MQKGLGKKRLHRLKPGQHTIRSLEEEYKYHLLFATSHVKGIILASDVVFGVEETYQKEVQEYQASTAQARQLSLFADIEPDPTPDEIFKEKVKKLCLDFRQRFQEQTLSREQIHATLLDTWFGTIKSKHVTMALKRLKDELFILEATGNISDLKAVYTFASH
jgi:hypothetical protein